MAFMVCSRDGAKYTAVTSRLESIAKKISRVARLTSPPHVFRSHFVRSSLAARGTSGADRELEPGGGGDPRRAEQRYWL